VEEVAEAEEEELTPMERKLDQETKERAEIETRQTRQRSTTDRTEEMAPAEEEEALPRVVLESSTKEPEQKDNTRREMLKAPSRRPPLVLSQRKKKRSQRFNTRKSSMEFHSMISSMPTQQLEPRREEMLKVLERMLRSKPIQLSRHTSKSPRSRIPMLTKSRVEELSMLMLLSDY